MLRNNRTLEDRQTAILNGNYGGQTPFGPAVGQQTLPQLQSQQQQSNPFFDYFNQSKNYQMGEVLNQQNGMGELLPIAPDPGQFDGGPGVLPPLPPNSQDYSLNIPDYSQPQFSGPIGGTQPAGQKAQMFGGQPMQTTASMGDLFNPIGTIANPNAFLRMANGYEQGGLLGALGYLLTDMNQQGGQQPQQQPQQMPNINQQAQNFRF